METQNMNLSLDDLIRLEKNQVKLRPKVYKTQKVI